MTVKSKLVLLAAALMSTTAMALPSRALRPETPARTETVKFKASEASTVEGATALYSKLQEAALRVCTDADAVDEASAMQNCAAEALTVAVQRVAIPMVSVLHLQAGRSALAAR